MKVQNIMTTEVFCVGAMQSLDDAAYLMYEHNCGSAPVVDQSNHLVGMVTDRDIAMAAYTNGGSLNTIPVCLAQSTPIVCCRADDELDDVQHLMQMNQVHRIPVIDDVGHPVGMLSLSDVACAYTSGAQGLRAEDISNTLASICSPVTARSSSQSVAVA